MTYPPPVIVPVVGSIMAPSEGSVSKAKVPPGKPEILASPPSQVGVIEKEESSLIKVITISSSISQPSSETIAV